MRRWKTLGWIQRGIAGVGFRRHHFFRGRTCVLVDGRRGIVTTSYYLRKQEWRQINSCPELDKAKESWIPSRERTRSYLGDRYTQVKKSEKYTRFKWSPQKWKYSYYKQGQKKESPNFFSEKMLEISSTNSTVLTKTKAIKMRTTATVPPVAMPAIAPGDSVRCFSSLPGLTLKLLASCVGGNITVIPGTSLGQFFFSTVQN